MSDSRASSADAPQEQLRREFNEWAEKGRGESMARHHRGITEKALARMALRPGERVLDLGCGSGWATRLLAERVGPSGSAMGIDISDAMIREAERESAGLANVRYAVSGADHIAAPDGAFTRVLSVESFYYYPDQRGVLQELKRVVAPGGGIALLMCLYEGHPAAARWAQELKVPVHMLSPTQYRELLSDCGWREVSTEEFTPEESSEAPDPHQFALLVTARR